MAQRTDQQLADCLVGLYILLTRGSLGDFRLGCEPLTHDQAKAICQFVAAFR